MFSPSHGQSVQAKVSNHIGDGSKRSTELSKDKFTGIFLPLDPHVHESFSAPAIGKRDQLETGHIAIPKFSHSL